MTALQDTRLRENLRHALGGAKDWTEFRDLLLQLLSHPEENPLPLDLAETDLGEWLMRQQAGQRQQAGPLAPTFDFGKWLWENATRCGHGNVLCARCNLWPEGLRP